MLLTKMFRPSSNKSFVFVTAVAIFHCSVGAVEILTLSVVAGVASTLYAGWRTFGYCKYYECCDKKWILNNFIGLDFDFQSKVHGQHLATEIFLKSLKDHLTNANPKKALVLSLNGRTGSGKNHVVNLALSRIYKLGPSSEAVKSWYSKLHFAHGYIEKYWKDLHSDVMRIVAFCPRSVFIFDEADLIPNGVIDVLKPLVDYHHHVDGLDFRKATFIFLSNTGGDEIANIANRYFEQHRERVELSLADIKPLQENGHFKEKGGIHELVDVYVPFLPLQKKHVRMCVDDELMRRGCIAPEKFVTSVVDSMDFDSADLHSLNGCKTVATKINIMLQDECSK